MQNRVNQKGFSLIELLVVVILISIIVAIAIPSLLRSRRSANEASAVANLRTVHSAQLTYLASNGNNAFADFAALVANGLIDLNWGLAINRNTYAFVLDRDASNTKYCVSAISTDSGAKDFGVGSEGVIYEAAHGNLNCLTGDLGGTITVFGSN